MNELFTTNFKMICGAYRQSYARLRLFPSNLERRHSSRKLYLNVKIGTAPFIICLNRKKIWITFLLF